MKKNNIIQFPFNKNLFLETNQRWALKKNEITQLIKNQQKESEKKEHQEKTSKSKNKKDNSPIKLPKIITPIKSKTEGNESDKNKIEKDLSLPKITRSNSSKKSLSIKKDKESYENYLNSKLTGEMKNDIRQHINELNEFEKKINKLEQKKELEKLQNIKKTCKCQSKYQPVILEISEISSIGSKASSFSREY